MAKTTDIINPQDAREYVRRFTLVSLADSEVVNLAYLAHRVPREDALTVLRDAALRLRMLEGLQVKERAESVPYVADPPMTAEDVMAELKFSHTYLHWVKQVEGIKWFRSGKRDMYRRSEVDRLIHVLETPQLKQSLNRKIDKWKAANRIKIDARKEDVA